jgi:2,3-bisphosphoglycerate-independent phosphoglycerate mutase
MKPLVLIILDGWGIAPPGPGNAISQLTTHNISSYWETFPHTQLLATGTAVGLPPNEAGNSETGHMNIGAGRVVDQDITRINRAIADGTFYTNATFLQAITHSREMKSNIHIMGVLSDAGVHASSGHLLALLKIMEQNDVRKNVYLHLFTDGRDALPKSALPIYLELEKQYPLLKTVNVATVMGRYYAMDRDNRVDRTKLASSALADTAEFKASSFQEAVTDAYGRSETDEFIKPIIITDASGAPYPRIRENDSVIFFNFRIDRTRQLTKALMTTIPHLYFVSMTEYETGTDCHVAYTPIAVSSPLGSVIEIAGLNQLHAAESEKERFVTYYFNGLKEEPYTHEKRIIVSSPKVATYDLAPSMSAVELTDKIIEEIKKNTYEFVVMNYANPDMVGHSGSVEATIKACETVDIQVQRIVETVLAQDGTAIITADHGHAEEMLSPTNEIQTEHTGNPVPCIICSNAYKNKNISLPPGVLGDIAPTILHSMNIPKPVEMTGHNVLDGVV